MAVRPEGEYLIQLYAVEDFFVEVSYCPASNQITRLQAFQTRRILEQYVLDIDLLALLNR